MINDINNYYKIMPCIIHIHNDIFPEIRWNLHYFVCFTDYYYNKENML